MSFPFDEFLLMSVPFHENPLLGFWTEEWIIHECEEVHYQHQKEDIPV